MPLFYRVLPFAILIHLNNNIAAFKILSKPFRSHSFSFSVSDHDTFSVLISMLYFSSRMWNFHNICIAMIKTSDGFNQYKCCENSTGEVGSISGFMWFHVSPSRSPLIRNHAHEASSAGPAICSLLVAAVV